VRRLVVLASLVVFTETLFYSVLAPLLPGLVAEFRVGTVAAGVLVAAVAVGTTAGAPISAALVQRVGSRASVAAGLALLCVATVLFALADRYWPLALARFAQGLAGAVIWTGALAWLAVTLPVRQRTEAVGFVFGVSAIGMLLGPVVGAVAAHVGRALTFMCLAGLGLAMFAVVLGQPAVETSPRPEHAAGSLFAALRRRQVRVAATLVGIPSVSFGLVGVVAPLRLDDLHLGPSAIGAIFTVGAAISVVASPLAGRWAARRGWATPVRTLLPVAAALALAFPYAATLWSFVAVLIAAWIVFDLLWVPLLARLSEHTERADLHPALGYALMNLALGPTYAIGAAVGPALADVTTAVIPFVAVAVVCLAAALPLWRRRPSLG
jgi:predicted MFS family arabinose efflux permease